MDRKPKLDQKVIDSLDAVQSRFTPADCADPALGPGLNYLVDLAKHFRSPKATARRQQVLQRSIKFREAKGKAA